MMEAAGIEPAEDSFRARLVRPAGTDEPLGCAALAKKLGLPGIPRSTPLVRRQRPIDELHPRGVRVGVGAPLCVGADMCAHSGIVTVVDHGPLPGARSDF